ncbi:MAG: PTS transporter subunit EIIC [Lacrimispora sphenoides]
MKEKKSMINVMIDGISGIFLPIINLLSAAGILKGILTILTASNIVSGTSETYLVLNAMADSLFYFLPMVLAFTAAKKFGCDPFTAVVIGGVLLYPSLTKVFEAGTNIFFAGIPMKAVIYHSGVIPIILAVGLLVYVERVVNKILPDLIKGFFAPLICIVVVGLVTLFVFGPIGNVIGDGLAAAYEFVYQISPMIAGAILGAVIQPMVIFGFHWSFVLVAMNNISVKGSDTILALIGPAVFAQAGAALAVCLRSKDKKFRSLCLSAVVSACFGVTEPAMFGVNLPLKKPMIAVCIGGGVGGAIAGFSGAQAMTFAFPSMITLPVFLGRGFGLFVVSCFAGFLTSFLLTLFQPGAVYDGIASEAAC